MRERLRDNALAGIGGTVGRAAFYGLEKLFR
nr:MAG TPA: hypothetical protein [Caudoviricetes sp.]DAH95928.1 MAG TPA: hypothetical protein [Caudoviricetes sp.]